MTSARELLEQELQAVRRCDYREAARLARERVALHPVVSVLPRGRAALTEAEVRDIRTSGESVEVLAERYDRSPSAIRSTRKGEIYAWVD